jgi:hypothetical protein
VWSQIVDRFIILDFKLSPCSERCMLSSGRFPGIFILNANVSELCSIFIGGYVWRIVVVENVRVFIREKLWLKNSLRQSEGVWRNWGRVRVEKQAPEQAAHKPVCWFKYVDDTFVIWPHSQEKLTLSEPPQWTQQQDRFTIEKEEGHHPFLDIDVYMNTNGFLGRRVYRKPTHTYLYIH